MEMKKPPVRKTSKLAIFISVFFIILIGAAVVWYVYIRLRGFQSTDDAYVNGDQLSLGASVPGRVIFLAVDEGDQVAQGQELIRLDDGTLKAEEREAAANLDFNAQNVTLAKVREQQAQSDFNRATIQLQSKIISQEQYEHVKTALEAAKAQRAIDEADQKKAEAQLYTVRTNLGLTRVVSPMSGVVAKKWVLPGDVVQPGQPVYTITNPDNVWITANFKENQVFFIRRSDQVSISIDAFKGLAFEGKVLTIGATTASQFALIPQNNAAGNFTKVTQRVPVKISIENADVVLKKGGYRLLPGMSATVKVKTGGD
jgi:membrane fusion protein (multidrug efflux system)